MKHVFQKTTNHPFAREWAEREWVCIDCGHSQVYVDFFNIVNCSKRKFSKPEGYDTRVSRARILELEGKLDDLRTDLDYFEGKACQQEERANQAERRVAEAEGHVEELQAANRRVAASATKAEGHASELQTEKDRQEETINRLLQERKEDKEESRLRNSRLDKEATRWCERAFKAEGEAQDARDTLARLEAALKAESASKANITAPNGSWKWTPTPKPENVDLTETWKDVDASAPRIGKAVADYVNMTYDAMPTPTRHEVSPRLKVIVDEVVKKTTQPQSRFEERLDISKLKEKYDVDPLYMFRCKGYWKDGKFVRDQEQDKPKATGTVASPGYGWSLSTPCGSDPEPSNPCGVHPIKPTNPKAETFIPGEWKNGNFHPADGGKILYGEPADKRANKIADFVEACDQPDGHATGLAGLDINWPSWRK